jgi:hypothetical protein
MAKNVIPFHHRESEHLRLRRPRNLLRSQQKMSQTRYKTQTKMVPSKQNQNLSYE